MPIKHHSEMHEEIISKFNELITEMIAFRKEIVEIKTRQMEIEHPKVKIDETNRVQPNKTRRNKVA